MEICAHHEVIKTSKDSFEVYPRPKRLNERKTCSACPPFFQAATSPRIDQPQLSHVRVRTRRMRNTADPFFHVNARAIVELYTKAMFNRALWRLDVAVLAIQAESAPTGTAIREKFVKSRLYEPRLLTLIVAFAGF
jgi:hypothetical protein